MHQTTHTLKFLVLMIFLGFTATTVAQKSEIKVIF